MTQTAMTETAERYRKVTAGFTDVVAKVSGDGWDRPTPCEGWVAREVLRHVVDTSAHFLAQAQVEAPAGPAVDEDPLGAWGAARDAVQAALADPQVAARTHESPFGPSTFEATVGLFGVGDALIHTWDLARATGQDETLDAAEVARMLAAMAQFDDSQLRQPGAFSPAVEVPAGADEQTRLIAFTGRQP